MTKESLRLLITSTLLISAAPTFALGIRIADQDASATARGNAFAATADNPSAIYYNPAGITQLEGQNVRLGFYSIYLKSDFESPSGAKFDTVNKVQFVPQLFYTIGFDKCPITLGLGLYSPYGLALSWPDTAPFRAIGREGKLTYATINPVLAWKICDPLSVAAGPTFNYGDIDLRQGLFVPGDQFRFTGDDTDIGFNVGLLWKPHEKHSVGLNYRSTTTLDFQGHADLRLLFPFRANTTEPASARFPFPQNIVLGYSFRPTTNWNIEANVDWTDWNRLNSVSLKKASGNSNIPFNWESSFFYELGATYLCHCGYALSAGYIYSENSVPSAFFNPIVPDSERHILSVGLGKKYKQFSWDAAYQFAYGPGRDINNGGPASGNYTFTSHALTVSVGIHF